MAAREKRGKRERGKGRTRRGAFERRERRKPAAPHRRAAHTVTVPGFMRDTISLVNMMGAVLPGMSAVVIRMSISSHCLVSIWRAAACHSSLIAFAYPPAPSPDS